MPIVVVLPVPLTPTIISTAGSPLRSIGARPVRGDLGEDLDQAVAHRLAVGGDGAGLDLVLEPLDHLGGGRRAGVGEDQRLLQPLPGLVVDAVEEAGRDLLGQRLAAFREALAQAPEDAAALLGSASGSAEAFALAREPRSRISCQLVAIGAGRLSARRASELLDGLAEVAGDRARRRGPTSGSASRPKPTWPL